MQMAVMAVGCYVRLVKDNIEKYYSIYGVNNIIAMQM